jgi:hypothetical protein
MTTDKIINKLASDADIFFYTFQQDDDTIIAKSHFFDFYFGTDSVKIVDSYVLPGYLLLPYLKSNLPIQFDYTLDNFYDVMLEYVIELQDTCIRYEQLEDND